MSEISGVNPQISGYYNNNGAPLKNNYINAELQPDSFGYQTEKPKNKLSGAKKWVTGIAIAMVGLYGLTVAHHALTKPSLEKVATNLSDILGKEISKEEALKMTERYKEIFKINDCKEFCTRMYEQVKKDYGYEKIDIPLNLTFLNREALFSFNKFREGRTMAWWHDSQFKMHLQVQEFEQNVHILFPQKMSQRNKRKVFTGLIQGFRSVKQSEIACRTDIDKYIASIYERGKYLSELCGKKVNVSVNDGLRKNFGQMPRFAEGSEEFKKGLEYINAKGPEIFLNELLTVKEKSESIYKYFTSIWHP